MIPRTHICPESTMYSITHLLKPICQYLTKKNKYYFVHYSIVVVVVVVIFVF